MQVRHAEGNEPVALLLARAAQLDDAGQLAAAEEMYQRALAKGRRNVTALKGLASIAMRCANPGAAHELYAKIVRMTPTADAFADLACGLYGLGRYQEALQACRKALNLRPDHLVAMFNAGVLLRSLARHEDAVVCFDKVLAIDPNQADALHNRGLSQIALRRFDDALASFERCLAVRGDTPDTLMGRSQALLGLRRGEEALAGIERALALNPHAVEGHHLRAAILLDLGRPFEALESVDRAVALRPDYPEGHAERGSILLALGRLAEAIAANERAIALMPTLGTAHYHLALCRLTSGDLRGGFAGHEWRWRADVPGMGVAPQFPQPLWLGEESLAGKTLLLHAEQGIGDVIQFVRYAPMAAALGATVVLQVPRSLVSVLAGLAGGASVVAQGEPLPPFDLHCPLMSLPLAFRTDLATVPATIPYLHGDPARVAAWELRLGPKSKPRIAIAWSGNPSHRNDRARSIPLAELLPLLDAPAQWISVQKEVRPGDAATLAARPDIVHVGDELDDFADTAALFELMDLVIVVDTSVAHLAGALGRPVWILLPSNPDWRWMREREDSPWYPSARLFRQAAPGDRDGVVARLRAALLESWSEVAR